MVKKKITRHMKLRRENVVTSTKAKRNDGDLRAMTPSVNAAWNVLVLWQNVRATMTEYVYVWQRSLNIILTSKLTCIVRRGKMGKTYKPSSPRSCSSLTWQTFLNIRHGLHVLAQTKRRFIYYAAAVYGVYYNTQVQSSKAYAHN